jgi:hypothetical protein
MRIVEAPGATGDYNTDLGSKARAAISAFESGEFDLGFLHVKAVDDAGVRQAPLASVFPCNPPPFALFLYFDAVDCAGIVWLAPAANKYTNAYTSILLFFSQSLVAARARRRKQYTQVWRVVRVQKCTNLQAADLDTVFDAGHDKSCPLKLQFLEKIDSMMESVARCDYFACHVRRYEHAL